MSAAKKSLTLSTRTSAVRLWNNDFERKLAANRNRTFSTPRPVTVIHSSAATGKLAAKRKRTVSTLRPVKVIHTSAADQLIRGILWDHHETKAGVRACSGVPAWTFFAAVKPIPEECWPRRGNASNPHEIIPINHLYSNTALKSGAKFTSKRRVSELAAVFRPGNDRSIDWPQGGTTPGLFAIMSISATEERLSAKRMRTSSTSGQTAIITFTPEHPPDAARRK